MTAVKLQGTFKKDEREFNGLESIAQELIDKPMRRHLVVGEVESTGYEVNFRDGGTKTPKVRWIHIEPMEGDAAETVRKLKDEAYHARTGQAAPPPSLFDEIGEAGPASAEGDAAPAEGGPWPGDADYTASAEGSTTEAGAEDADPAEGETGKRGRRK